LAVLSKGCFDIYIKGLLADLNPDDEKCIYFTNTLSNSYFIKITNPFKDKISNNFLYFDYGNLEYNMEKEEFKFNPKFIIHKLKQIIFNIEMEKS